MLTACDNFLLEDVNWLHHRHACVPILTAIIPTALYRSNQACSVAVLPTAGTILDGFLCALLETCDCSPAWKNSVGFYVWLNSLLAEHGFAAVLDNTLL